MPKVSVESKGSAPDASDYIAYKRRQALLRSQQAKTPAGDPNQKPIIGREFLNQKGFDSGIIPWRFNNGKILDQTRFR